LRAHGARLRGLILYGSEARSEAKPDSDIDLLVLLEGPLNYGRDMETCLRAVYSLVLETGRPISAKPVCAEQYDKADIPLYQTARREGIAI